MQGQLNPWVLEQARCAELADSWEEFEPTFRQANEEIRGVNSNITGAPRPVPAVLLCSRV